MHNERCMSGSGGGPEKPIGRKADRALRSGPTCFSARAAKHAGASVVHRGGTCPSLPPPHGGNEGSARDGAAGITR